MKKLEVYKRRYNKKDLPNYFKLIEKIKDTSIEEKEPIIQNNEETRYLSYTVKYINYDGDFLSKIKINELSKSYDSSISNAEIRIDKTGQDMNKLSLIENILLKEGFKKEK